MADQVICQGGLSQIAEGLLQEGAFFGMDVIAQQIPSQPLFGCGLVNGVTGGEMSHLQQRGHLRGIVLLKPLFEHAPAVPMP
ncbi:hypothetical protein [Nonomuraea sp. KM90]|uniref:hypothetical protein n=1 Tax=Nonomuraea sp. KM90 TaxID=3457428 RepID=UPI003FCE6433